MQGWTLALIAAAACGAGAAPAVRCPTEHEIRSAEISASSMTNSPEQRRAMWQAVENMRACGRR
jgi:hypothetical protein